VLALAAVIALTAGCNPTSVPSYYYENDNMNVKYFLEPELPQSLTAGSNLNAKAEWIKSYGMFALEWYPARQIGVREAGCEGFREYAWARAGRRTMWGLMLKGLATG
jgi:hypothetical protein